MRLLIVVAFISSMAQAYIDPSVPPMSNARVQQAVTNAFPVVISTLDQLPAVLPEDFRMNFVLKHGIKRTGERGHLVETIVSQSADPLLPRAIIWDERSGYTLSYNGGGREQTAAHRLDVLRFDNAAKSFHLEKVDFPLNQPGQLNFTSQGTDCLTCHGPSGRPIFSMYPDWPAFYGSDNDELLDSNKDAHRKELTDFQSFINQTAGTHSRYRPLFNDQAIRRRLGVRRYPTFPYRYDLQVSQEDASRAFAFRPGLRLGLMYNRLMAQHLMAKLQQHGNFARMGKFFLYNLLQCGTISADQTKARAEVARAVTEAQKLGVRTTLRGNVLMDYRAMWSLVGLKLNDVDIRFSYNHAGFNNTDASQNYMGVGYIGNYFNSYFDGSATIDELLAAQLFSYYSARHPGLSQLPVTLRGLTEKYSRFTARMNHDAPFFASMDSMSRWIPIPYPAAITSAHHREIYQNRFTEQHRLLCGNLEGMLWWPTRP